MIFLMHELRYINSMIKSSSELLSKTVRGEKVDFDNLKSHAMTIFEQSSVLSSWLAIVDYHLDPKLFEKYIKSMVSLYRKFDKARLNFKRRAQNLGVGIHLIGQGEFSIEAYPIIDILPYLLIDNALKYSIKSGSIDVNFSSFERINVISVKAMGPFVESEELKNIFTSGFRGKNAIKVSALGNGMGLALVKKICEIHSATISATSSAQTISFNNCPFSEFTITMRFPNLDA